MSGKRCFIRVFMIYIILISGVNADSKYAYNQNRNNDSLQFNSDNYAENVHMYICIQSLQLLKNIFPQNNFSLFDGHIGTLNDFGDRPWQTGQITTGAYREDKEDPVFGIRGPFGFYASNSHFWNADNRSGGDNSLTTLNIFGINSDYPNAMTKIKKYADGQWFIWNGSGYSDRKFIEYNAANGYIYRLSYHSSGLVQFYRTGRIWLESKINTLGQVVNVRDFIIVSDIVRDAIVWEVLGRMAHLTQDMTVPAHTHNDVHVRFYDGGDCYHNYIDDGAYQNYNWQTANANGGFINPYSEGNDPLRYIIYSSNQLADHFPSGPDCLEIPQQHFGNNNLPGGTYNILNSYYQQLGMPPQNINDVNEESRYCFNHAIRATAALFYWFAVETGIFSTDPLSYPLITGFSKNLPDYNLFRGETLTAECFATGPNLRYDWFVKVCDSGNTCLEKIPGLNYVQEGNKFKITNNNFLRKWTCSAYDSLCGIETKNPNNERSLFFLIGVRVSNQFGSTEKYFNFRTGNFFYPYDYLRPPPPPVTGCPWIIVNNGERFVYENNILKKSEFKYNTGKDVQDKYILSTDPFTDPADKLITVAVKETAADRNLLDNFSLYAFDFPDNRIPGITENNDLVLYDVDRIVSPLSAELSGKDITKDLEYDSVHSGKISGKAFEELNIIFPPITNGREYTDNSEDSIALILDPGSPYNPYPVVKDISGFISATDFSGNSKPGITDFGMRQLSSEVIIPLFKSDGVKTVNVRWERDFELSYIAAVPVHYSGFNVYKLPFAYAEDFHQGNVTELLRDNDKNYSVLDSTSFLILKFEANPETIPPGMKRKYLLSVNGRYSKTNLFSKSDFGESNSAEDSNQRIYKLNKLYDNYPNPFNPVTVIRYNLAEDNNVKIRIFNILGKEIAVIKNEFQKSGIHQIEFNASDIPAGIYFYTLSSGDYIETKKMVVLK
jgi:hypothetical protein